MPDANYSGAQPDLYNAARICIAKVRTQQAVLMAFKPRFTVAFLDNLEADVEAADLLPDYSARKAMAKIAKLEAIDGRKKLTQRFAKLVSFIDDAHDADKRQLMYDAAGMSHLKDAKNNKWGSVTSLASSMWGFFDTYGRTMTAQNHLPAAFEADARAECAAFKVLYATLTTTESDVTSKKDEKINANNAIYDTCQNMLTNMRLALEDDNPELANQFTFANFLNQAKGTKNAGLNGTVTLEATGEVIKGVVVIIEGTNRADETDAEGYFNFNPLAVDKYTVIFKGEGLITQSFEKFAIKTGTVSRLNVKMVADPDVKTLQTGLKFFAKGKGKAAEKESKRKPK